MLRRIRKHGLYYSIALALVVVSVTIVYAIRYTGENIGSAARTVSAAWAQDDRGSAQGSSTGASSDSPAPEAPDILNSRPCVSWQTFTKHDGLPSDKVFCVKADGSRVWAGTDNGLACYEDGQWRTYGTEDGMPYRAVLSLDVSPRTGDLWIGTMGGLARFSGGRFDVFTQRDCGLSNDFIYQVRCDPDRDEIWAATAMGASRFNLRTRTWTTYDDRNTPMHEPWTYAVAVHRGFVYIGAWGGGILEYKKDMERWREYRDPDGEFDVDILPDDGPIHDIVSGLDYLNGILWEATYFGASRYDGRRWRTYNTEDSGLVSDFINFVQARDLTGWFCTDDGLSGTDGENWVTYRCLNDGRGEILFHEGRNLTSRRITPTAIGHNFVLGVDFQDDALWVATEKGVSRGTP